MRGDPTVTPIRKSSPESACSWKKIWPMPRRISRIGTGISRPRIDRIWGLDSSVLVMNSTFRDSLEATAGRHPPSPAAARDEDDPGACLERSDGETR